MDNGMKNILKINGVIQKIAGDEISEEEVELIQDEILDILEKHGYLFGGIWKHQPRGVFSPLKK